jgi:hypothetical protein
MKSKAGRGFTLEELKVIICLFICFLYLNWLTREYGLGVMSLSPTLVFGMVAVDGDLRNFFGMLSCKRPNETDILILVLSSHISSHFGIFHVATVLERFRVVGSCVFSLHWSRFTWAWAFCFMLAAGDTPACFKSYFMRDYQLADLMNLALLGIFFTWIVRVDRCLVSDYLRCGITLSYKCPERFRVILTCTILVTP